MRQALQNWNMRYNDVARSPESAARVFTSSERLASQLKEGEVGEVGRLVKKIEMDDMKTGRVVEKVSMDEWRS